MNKSIAVIVATLGILAGQGIAQEPQDQKTAEATANLTIYDKMEKKQLQESLKKLQKEVLVSEQLVKQAKDNVDEATKAYKSAADNQKPEFLLRMVEAQAKSRKPLDNNKQVNAEFEAAKRAYLNLLLTEER